MNCRTVRIASLALLLAGATPAAAQSFEDGFAAYKSGDFDEAIEEWRPLAEQGDSRAMLGMARINAIVKRDFDLAVTFYKRAATAGLSPAMVDLGNIYYAGQGVERDYVEAYKWFELAVSYNSTLGRNELAELTEMMSDSEIAEAKQRARAWLAATR